MIPKNRVTTHPCLILLKEFLEPMGLTQKELAEHLEIPVQRIIEIVNYYPVRGDFSDGRQ